MDDLDKLAKKVKNKTKLEEEKESKLKAGEFSEELDATGQENEEEAAKWVIEVNKENDEKKQAHNDTLLEFFEDRTSLKTYEYYLCKLMYSTILKNILWPKGFSWRATYNQRGVAVIVKDPEGKFLTKGFKPSHEAKYDLNAISKIYWACENLIDEYEEKSSQVQDDQQGQAGSVEPSGNNIGDQESQAVN